MKKIEFMFYYNEVVRPTAGRIQAEYGLEVRPACADVVFEEYLLQRTKLREQFQEDVHGRLDRHKVCACMTAAIINARMITQPALEDDRGRAMKDFQVWPNEHLAFLCALQLLRAYILSDAEKNGEETRRLRFDVDMEWALPRSYQINCIASEYVRAIFTSRINDTLSVPLLAVLYFNIEAYHELAKGTITAAPGK